MEPTTEVVDVAFGSEKPCLHQNWRLLAVTMDLCLGLGQSFTEKAHGLSKYCQISGFFFINGMIL